MTAFSLKNYKAIIFDLDSTLTDTHRYPLRAAMWLLEKTVDDVDAVAEEYVSHLVANYRKGLKEIIEGAEYSAPYDVVKRAMRESLEAMNLAVDPGVVEEGTRLFRWLHVETSTAYPGTEELLTKLHESALLLGAVTNSFENHIQLILSKLNLLHFFKCIVDAGDVKAYKPMPQPFQQVIQCLGATAKDCLFVGDEFYADIVGATSLGIDAIWINNRNADLPQMLEKYGAQSQPRLVVDSIATLLDFL
ncbi:MAG: HAD family hydrolase [Candidatus Thorarchaeota archaeon]